MFLSLPACSQPKSGPLVLFADGAGWWGSTSAIRSGLRAAGYRGRVKSFPWSTMLGPGPDHFLVSRKKSKGKDLAARIKEHREREPNASLHLMGLSAGTAVVVYALEQLPAGVTVDNVVLFSPSISERHDLTKAMKHVTGRLYVTCSPRDGILSGLAGNADGEPGKPAGLHGLRVPGSLKRYDLYARVMNLRWRPAYAGFGWHGGHTGVIDRQFVQHVIAPRVLADEAHPLDRPLAGSARRRSLQQERTARVP